MKRRFISIIAVIAIICTSACSSALAVDFFTYGDSVGTESGVYDTILNYGRNIVESDKYVFLVVGASGPGFMARSKVHIYQKPDSENIGYQYLTSIRHGSVNASWDLPVRNIWVNDDTLYITWNNVKTMKTNYASALRGEGSISSPVYSYDISEIEKGDTLTGTLVYSGGPFAPAVNPYNRGGASFLDEENELFYQAVYSGSEADSAVMNYRVYDVSGSTPELTKTLAGGSVDTNQFIINGDYLFEVLQNNGGIGVTGRISQAFNNVRIYDISALEDGSDISTSALLGSYTTELTGDWVINDIEVYGDTMYLATTGGLEVVDISEAKSASSTAPAELALSERLHSGKTVNGVVTKDDKLYVGLSTGMVIYDVSAGVPAEIVTCEVSGGFQDFAVSEEDNLLYALSASQNGKVTMVNLDLIFNTLEVSEPAYTIGGQMVTQITDGDLNVNMSVINTGTSEKEFSTFYMLYEGNRLAQLSIKDWYADAGARVDITDTLRVEDADISHVKLILTNIGDPTKLIPMLSASSVEFKKEFGNKSLSEFSSSEIMNIGDMDTNGNISVSGKIDDLKGKPMLVKVSKPSADESDRLGKIRYLDVLTVGNEGDYSFEFMPLDGGTYVADMTNILGMGTVSGETEVPEASITLGNNEEIPGVESNLYVSLTNGQNVDKINLEVSFDGENITVSDEIITSEQFKVSDVTVEGGSLTAVFTKLETISTEENEFCTIPIAIGSEAEIGDYDISISAVVMDKYETVLDATVSSGVLSIKETTLKYTARDAAIAALKELKKSDEITVDDYLTQLSKATEARTKVNEAYDFSLRDSQLGKDLVNNLTSVETKLAEIKPYYDALDVLEATDAANIAETLKTNKAYFDIDDKAIEVYDTLTNTSEIDTLLVDTDYTKPSDVYKTFYEALVLNGFAETRWQNVEKMLDLANEASGLDLAAYSVLKDTQKVSVQQTLALKKYDSISALRDALNVAVRHAMQNNSEINISGGKSSSKTSSSSVSTVFIPAPAVTETPKSSTSVAFSDIAQCAWAEEAIVYLSDKGVINGIGDGLFAPNDNVTREAFAKMICLAFAINESEGSMSFTDVTSDKWYGRYVYALSNAGIVKGRSDGSFGVGDYITREEIAVILDRVLSFKGKELNSGVKADFSDSSDISDYALSAMNKMYSYGVISGFDDGTVRPMYKASRAQAAQLIYKVMLMQ